MKKIGLFITAVVVSLSLGGRVLADTNTVTFADKAGITPDNTILYPIDKTLDDLKVSIASGDDKEAEALVDVAEERLGESEVMADKEKTDLSNQALTEYVDKITKAQDKIDDAIDKTPDSTTDGAIKLEELEKLETTTADRQMKSIEVLKNIETKVSGNAKETLALVIEMQTRKKEAIIAAAKERQTLLQDKKAVREAEKNLEQAKKSGEAEAVKAAEATLTDAQLALNIQKEKFNQVVSAKKEAMKGGVGQLKKEAKKEHAKDSSTSTDNTTSKDTNAAAGTTSAQNNEATTTASTNTSTTNTSEGTANTDTDTTSNNKTDVKVKENKGQEMKADKENKGHDMKANKEDKSENEHNSRH